MLYHTEYSHTVNITGTWAMNSYANVCNNKRHQSKADNSHTAITRNQSNGLITMQGYPHTYAIELNDYP